MGPCFNLTGQKWYVTELKMILAGHRVQRLSGNYFEPCYFLLYLAPNFCTASYFIFCLYSNYIVISDICTGD